MRNIDHIRNDDLDKDFAIANGLILQSLDSVNKTYLLDSSGYQGTQYEKSVLNFNGVDGYVDVSGIFPTTNILQTNGVSFACYAKIGSTGSFTLFSHTDNADEMLMLSLHDSQGIIVNYFRASNIYTHFTNTTIDLTVFHHFAVTFDFVNDEVNLYVDAQLLDTRALDTDGTLSSTKTIIGARDNSGTIVTNFNGAISDVVVYNDVFTSSDIFNLFKGKYVAGSQYLFEERISTTAFDSSGNGNHGTLVGGITHEDVRIPVIEPTQLIPDASSEFKTDGTSYWSLNRSTTVWNDTPDYTMTVTSTASGTNFGIFKSGFVTNKRYRATFRARSSNFFKAFQSIGNNADIGTVIHNPVLTTQWQEYEFEVLLNQINFRIYSGTGSSIGSDFEIDNIKITDLTNIKVVNHTNEEGYSNALLSDISDNVFDTKIERTTDAHIVKFRLFIPYDNTSGTIIGWGTELDGNFRTVLLKSNKIVADFNGAVKETTTALETAKWYYVDIDYLTSSMVVTAVLDNTTISSTTSSEVVGDNYATSILIGGRLSYEEAVIDEAIFVLNDIQFLNGTVEIEVGADDIEEADLVIAKFSSFDSTSLLNEVGDYHGTEYEKSVYSFNGVDGYVEVVNELEFTDVFTVGGCFKFNNFNNHQYIGSSKGSSTNNIGISSNSTEVRLKINNTWGTFSFGDTMPTNEWVFLAFVRGTDNIIRVFLNNYFTSGTSVAIAGTFKIGTIGKYASDYADMNSANVFIIGDDLSASELEIIKSGDYSQHSFNALLKQEERTGTIAFDSSGNENHGTLMGGVTHEEVRVPTIRPTLLIPSASSKFETDGTSYWGLLRATKAWNPIEQTMTITSTDDDLPFGIVAASGTAINISYRVKFRARSINFTGKFASIGDTNELGTVISNPNMSTNWQEYEFEMTQLTPNVFRIYSDSSPSLNDEIEFDDIVLTDLTSFELVNHTNEQGYSVGNNHIAYSNDFSNWEVNTVDTPTVIDLNDGSYRISGITANHSGYVIRENCPALHGVTVDGDSFTGSIEVKGEGLNVGKSIRIELQRETGTFWDTDTTVELTNEFQTITVSGTVEAIGVLGIRMHVQSALSNAADSVIIRNAQVNSSAVLQDFQDTNENAGNVGVIIPLDESNSTQDVLGNDLQFVGKVAADMKLVQSNCLSFNGVDGYGLLSEQITLSGDFRIGMYIEPSALPAANTGLVSSTDGNNVWSIQTDRMDAKINSVWQSGILISPELSTSSKVYVELERTGTILNVYIDGNLAGQKTSAETGDFLIDRVGRYAGNYYQGKLYGIDINGEAFNLTEGSGTTCYAREDETKTLALNGGATWGTQDVYHANINEGFSEGVNMSPYSEEFDNSYWVKSATASITSNDTIAPNGEVTADKLYSNTTSSNNSHFQKSITLIMGETYTVSILAKADEVGFLQLFFGGNDIVGNPRANFDLTNGVLGSVDSNVTAQISDEGGGYYRCSVEFVAAETNVQTYFMLSGSSSTARGSSSLFISGDGLHLWGCQIEKGLLSDYQKAGAAPTKSVKLPYQINGAYTNPIAEGHNGAESKLIVGSAFPLMKLVQGGTFDGSTQWVTANSSLSALSSYDITLNLKDITIANCNIIDARDANNDGIVFWYVNSLSTLRFMHNSTTIDIQTSGIDDGEYNFVWNGSTVFVYKDGVLVESASDSSAISTATNVRIGSRNFISPSNNVVGRISGVKVITDGVTIIDEPLNGTLNNATLTGDTSTFWVEEYVEPFFDSNGDPVIFSADVIGDDYLGLGYVTSENLANITLTPNQLGRIEDVIPNTEYENVILPRISGTNLDVSGGIADFTGKVAANMKLVNSNCLNIGATSAYLQLDYSLVGVEIVSYQGTCVPEIDVLNDRITFSTTGLLYNLQLSEDVDFDLAEGQGVVCYARGDEANALTLSGSITWDVQDNYHANINKGFSFGFNIESGDYYDTGITDLADGDTLSCIFISTDTKGILYKSDISNTYYTLVYDNTSGTNALNDAVSVIIDGIEYTSITRQELQFLICDGFYHNITVTLGPNASLWNEVRIGGYPAGFEMAAKMFDNKHNGIPMTGMRFPYKMFEYLDKSTANFNGSKYITTDDYGEDKLIDELEFWGYMDYEVTPTYGVRQIIGTYHDVTSYSGIAIGAATGALTGEVFTILHNGTGRTATTETIPIGWHQYKIVWNGSDYDIYIDNELKTTITTGVIEKLNARQVWLATRQSITQTWTGFMYDLKITSSGELVVDESLDGSIVRGTLTGSETGFWIKNIPDEDSYYYTNPTTLGHNRAETQFTTEVYRENLALSSFHYDQTDQTSEVISYEDINVTTPLRVIATQTDVSKTNITTYSLDVSALTHFKFNNYGFYNGFRAFHRNSK